MQLPAAPAWKERAAHAEQEAGADVSVETLLKSISGAHMSAKPSPWGLVHYHISLLYAEGQNAKGGMVCNRRMVDAMAGIYHLRMAALGGVPLACLQLWRMHANLRPVSSKISSLAIAAAPLFQKLKLVDSQLANAYLLMAAKGGVMGAAAKVAQKYASGNGLEQNAAEAAFWYETVMQVSMS